MNPRQQLQEIAGDNLLRSLQPGKGSGMRISRDGKELWNFASNDYLGLSFHPTLTEAFIEGITTYGTGSAASRLVTGTSPAHTHLEEKIAVAKHTQAALTFSSGYSTALATIPVIAEKGDFIILDKLAHACLIDAARMSEATLRIFPHNHLEKLNELLSKLRSKHSESRILVVTESVFSMDGDLCPLREILELCETHGAELLLDEAHGLGVLGPTGMGLAEQLGLQDRVHFQMGTLSKALGLSGGYLAASRDWIDLIINRARPFIYTTAPPPALAYTASVAFDLVQSNEGQTLREKLFENVSLLYPNHPTAILPMIIGENQAAITASQNLADQGFLIPAIRYPTVPRNTARLRVTISAAHPQEALAALAADPSFCF
ncbi:MAG: aminotransferase class I/II-fold pyridoxal phosphate-dependent enzyme [Akkermansiaceae bacterium]